MLKTAKLLTITVAEMAQLLKRDALPSGLRKDLDRLIQKSRLRRRKIC